MPPLRATAAGCHCYTFRRQDATATRFGGRDKIDAGSGDDTIDGVNGQDFHLVGDTDKNFRMTGGDIVQIIMRS